MERRAKSDGNNMNPLAGQYRCMLMLEKTGTVSQRRMAAILKIRSTSLSEVLFKLEKKQWIVRTPSSEDKRTYDVALTRAGYEEAERVRRQRLLEHQELMFGLSDEDLDDLIRILNKIKHNYMTVGDGTL